MLIDKSLFDVMPPRRRLQLSVAIGLLLVVVHSLLANFYISHPPFYDEMYHMLAAESWRDNGELHILDGEYARASLYTKMVALNGLLCGPSLECARALSVAAAAALIFIVTVFSGTAMHPLVGAISGAFLAVNPSLVMAAQTVRFYTLHAFTLAAFAFMVFAIISNWRKLSPISRLSLGALALALLLLSGHLHALTQLGLLAVVVATAIVISPNVLTWLRDQRPWLLFVIAALTVAATVLGLSLIDVPGKFEALRSGPGWAEGHEDLFLHYYRWLRLWYPLLWPTIGVLAILAIFRWPKISVYCFTVFSVAFLVLSVAGAKTPRYILFALPFLFIPVAGGVVTILQLAYRFLSVQLSQITGLPVTDVLLRMVTPVLIITAAIPALVNQPVLREAIRMVSDPDYTGEFRRFMRLPDWSEAAPDLRALVADYPVVVTCSGVKAAYYLGDFSFDLNHSVMLETDSGDEFGLDTRTGRRVVSSPESIRRITQACGRVLVLVEEGHMQEPMVSEEVLNLLDQLGNRFMVTNGLWAWIIEGTGRESDDAAQATLDCRPVVNPYVR